MRLLAKCQLGTTLPEFLATSKSDIWPWPGSRVATTPVQSRTSSPGQLRHCALLCAGAAAARRQRQRPRRHGLMASAGATATSELPALQRRSVAELGLGLLVVGAAPRADAAVESLRGRTACVTGASRGIGKGIAVGLGEVGATVFVTGRRLEAIAQTAELVTQAGGTGVPVLCDHADDEQVRKAFAEIGAQTGGKLDILVNNAWQDPGARNAKTDAALSRGAKFYDLPLQVWDDVHQVGLRSHYVASYYAAPLMQKAVAQDWRPLICMISAPAAVTYYFAAAYGVGKAATDRLARDLQVELGTEGIDCISIWPGVVYTETVQRLYETGDVERLNRVTGGLDPNDICESPLLTGRVIAKFGADPRSRQAPLISPDGLAGRICVVAEGAQAFGIRDGGLPGTTAEALYGPDRQPPPSFRSAGYLFPAIFKQSLPEEAKWIAEANGPVVKLLRDVTIPFDIIARDPRREDPRKQDLKEFAGIVTNVSR